MRTSGVARAFPGGRVAHPEGQNEEENKKSVRKNKKNWSKFEERMRKVELLPTRDCEAGYGPDVNITELSRAHPPVQTLLGYLTTRVYCCSCGRGNYLKVKYYVTITVLSHAHQGAVTCTSYAGHMTYTQVSYSFTWWKILWFLVHGLGTYYFPVN